MALELPDSEFVGLDLSPRQIEQAQRQARELDAKNVRFETADLRQWTPSGKFDYIIAHGFFSWVPDDARARLLAVISESLSDNGMAFVSYNAKPGWHSRSAMRWMMRFHTAGIADPREQVSQARALLHFLTEHQAEGIPWERWLSAEREQLRKRDDSFVFHDLLEPDNRAFSLAEFAQSATDTGLHYLGEADFTHLGPESMSPDLRAGVGHLASSRFELQQLDDLVRNRTFHKSVISKLKPSPDPLPERLRELFVYAEVTSEGRQGDTQGVSDTLRQANRANPREYSLAETTATTTELLALCADQSLDLLCRQRDLPTQAGPTPTSSPLARWQLKQKLPWLTNRRHQGLQPDSLDRALLPMMDGTRDQAELAQGLVELASTGALTVSNEGGELPESQLKEAMTAGVEQRLSKYVGAALLV